MCLILILKKTLKKIISILLNNNIVSKIPKTTLDLLIYDDIFPHPVSGFRLEEFKFLLNHFRKSKILVEPTAYPILQTKVEQHVFDKQFFVKKNKKLKNVFIDKENLDKYNIRLFYCIFFHNICKNINWLEENNIPFVFSLTPGGGFEFDNYEIDLKLKELFSSPVFKKVIVTQKIVKEYLIRKKLCEPNKIEFIFGVVVPQETIYRINNKSEKITFDILFCASKYMPLGLDKGYDDFISIAHKLFKFSDKIRFHVVGGFNEYDIDISEIKDVISFYDYQNSEKLNNIFKNIDIIVSPNKPFILRKGAFDGFPLAVTVEAVLSGAVAIVNDYFCEGSIFNNNEEIIITDGDVETYVEKIKFLFENPDKKNLISELGRKKFIEIYKNENQMLSRVKILESII